MPRKTRIDALGASVLIGFALAMGLNQVMIKLVNGAFHPVFQAGLRSALAFVLILGWARWRGRKLSLTDGSLWPGLLSGVIFSVEFGLLFNGLEYTSVTRSSILFYTMPIWVAAAAHVLIPGERLTPRRLLGLALAIGGVVLALSGNAAPHTAQALTGDLMCLAASFCWTTLVLLVRLSRLNRATAEMQLLYQLGLSAPVLLALTPFLGEAVRSVTPGLMGLFAVQVVAVVSVSFVAWFWVLSVYPTSDVASYGFLSPVFGVLFGWLLLGEPISGRVVGALALVGLGIVLVTRRPAPPAGSA
ncbi:DMT family transporter [Paroceanicella profunda]|uniref:DMT family transporter n=1 Tax=Paroceanicella profunda TaxID=2579971 RepID=A0A5B8FHT8_9RHOB|nr:DMT family transporter [Paroceanicella profunda]QDL92851.1 DMT family transporter [Paroceanicella profunda]